jgi:AraC-like DNA-binding protein
MDILSDLLRQAGLRRRLLDVHTVSDGEALRFPCERSVGFHVVLAGVLWVHTDEVSPPLRLEAGDVAIMARGCRHLLATREHLHGLPIGDITALGGVVPADQLDGVHVVSGAYQLWNTPLHPLFAEWPAWHVVRASRTATLEPVPLLVSMLAGEMRSDAMGRETVVYGLLDALFTHLLRDIVAQRAGKSAGFSQALRDPHVRKAVTLMHEASARDWTLDTLARAVGLSRSVLAERFRTAMNDTPLSYLRTVRLQRAMRLLAEGDATLERVAAEVGYNDPFGFSKAFKRVTGISPGEFRRQNRADGDAGWRFTGSEALGAG